jgi:hypothetical protein
MKKNGSETLDGKKVIVTKKKSKKEILYDELLSLQPKMLTAAKKAIYEVRSASTRNNLIYNMTLINKLLQQISMLPEEKEDKK